MEERTCFEDGEGLRILEMNYWTGVRSVKDRLGRRDSDVHDHHIKILDDD